MKRFAFIFLFAMLAGGAAALLAPGARADDDKEDELVRLHAELAALRREVHELRDRVGRLEAQVAQQAAAIAAVPSEVKPELSPELGFVVPAAPRTAFGSSDPGDLARELHHAATTAVHEVDSLVAFTKRSFWLTESLWSKAAGTLKIVVGLPTRDELELALGALREAGAASRLEGLQARDDLTPRGRSDPWIRVYDLTVRTEDKRSETYRLTAARVGGRWVVAHLLALTAEDEARAFLKDIEECQWSYRAVYQVKYAKSLLELVAARGALEAHEGLKKAGLGFPLGGRLDHEKLDWVKDELETRFYRFRIVGDEAGGWTATATPRSPSYKRFQLEAPSTAEIGKRLAIKEGS